VFLGVSLITHFNAWKNSRAGSQRGPTFLDLVGLERGQP